MHSILTPIATWLLGLAVLGAPSAHARMSFAEFAKQVTEKGTLGEALRLLPQEYRQNYTLMRESLSLHESSATAPRVISFGETGETIYTFNGEVGQRNYHGLEIADFNSKTMRLEFREIVFKAESDLPRELKARSELSHRELVRHFDLQATEVEFQNQWVIVSKANPQKCLTCHGTTANVNGRIETVAKYIWGPYRGWKGAYGELEGDRLGSSMSKENSAVIVSEFLKFKKKVGGDRHPRYGWLDAGNSEAFPFHAYDHDFRNVDKLTSEPALFRTKPNTRLTFMVAANYARMVADIIFQHPSFQAAPRAHLRRMLCDRPDEDPYLLNKGEYDVFLDTGSLAVFREKDLQLPTYWASQDDVLSLKSGLGDLIKTHLAYLSRSLLPKIELPEPPVAETMAEPEFAGTPVRTVDFLTRVGKLDMRWSHPLKTHSPSPDDLVIALCKSLTLP